MFSICLNAVAISFCSLMGVIALIDGYKAMAVVQFILAFVNIICLVFNVKRLMKSKLND